MSVRRSAPGASMVSTGSPGSGHGEQRDRAPVTLGKDHGVERERARQRHHGGLCAKARGGPHDRRRSRRCGCGSEFPRRGSAQAGLVQRQSHTIDLVARRRPRALADARSPGYEAVLPVLQARSSVEHEVLNAGVLELATRSTITSGWADCRTSNVVDGTERARWTREAGAAFRSASSASRSRAPSPARRCLQERDPNRPTRGSPGPLPAPGDGLSASEPRGS